MRPITYVWAVVPAGHHGDLESSARQASRRQPFGPHSLRVVAISLKTHKMLWGRSGNRCAFPGCGQVLVAAEEGATPAVVGFETHIVARANDGPRGAGAN